MSIVEKKLRSLFDFQKFEREPGLQAVIDDAGHDNKGIRKLTEEELELAAGGVNEGDNSEDMQAYGRCTVKGCGSYLRPYMDGFICSNLSCGARYDAKGHPINFSDNSTI